MRVTQYYRISIVEWVVELGLKSRLYSQGTQLMNQRQINGRITVAAQFLSKLIRIMLLLYGSFQMMAELPPQRRDVLRAS